MNNLITTLIYCVYSDDEYQLSPGQSMMFTWSDPCKKREIIWWLSTEKDSKNIMELKVNIIMVV